MVKTLFQELIMNNVCSGQVLKTLTDCANKVQSSFGKIDEFLIHVLTFRALTEFGKLTLSRNLTKPQKSTTWQKLSRKEAKTIKKMMKIWSLEE